MEFFEEIWEEITDFFEDFWEHLSKRRPTQPSKIKRTTVNGAVATVRPAYLFAERIDNLLRILFGISILISALTASFLGFTSLSELLELLIFTSWGRLLMLVIGLSYLILGTWKLMHLHRNL